MRVKVQSGTPWVVLCMLLVIFPVSFLAQTQAQSFEPVVVPEKLTVQPVPSLPSSQKMALALATPGSRNQALLDLAVAANLLGRANQDVATDQSIFAQQFLDDRAWLQRLVETYGWNRPHSSVLDPAAWLVLARLQENDLEVATPMLPNHIPKQVLLYQVFQRVEERQAAAILPVLLLEIEAEAVRTWDDYLQLTRVDGAVDPSWGEVANTWFSDRQVPFLTTPDEENSDQRMLTGDILEALSKLVLSTIDAKPEDASAVTRMRYSLLMEFSGLAAEKKQQARNMLHMVSLVDGLHEDRYFAFAQGLLSLAFGLLERSTGPGGEDLLVAWLVAELPAVSAHYAEDFAGVDPRLNAAMTTIYTVLQGVASSPGNSDGPAGAHTALVDSVAQLALHISDMGYYFDTPVRTQIEQGISNCANMVTDRDNTGAPTMTRRQFDTCMENLLQLAEHETRSAELSGNVNGPFTAETLIRELNVPPWQRVNFVIGYLHESNGAACQPPAMALPNPLEWAVLANTMAWFAEYSPEFFDSPESEARLARMRGIGEQLVLDLAGQVDCFAVSGTNTNDLITRGMADYELALRQLNTGMDEAEADFRLQRLKPGADVMLEGDVAQKTAYRPDDLVIEPCDRLAVCEMSGKLTTTRALIGLFPDQYLVADQSGLGRIEICYRNMEWVERRSELVRPDDDNVANYFGRLGFDLVGRYFEGGGTSDIFGFRFTSPQEHHYLIAQGATEVLEDSCPVEWVGSRVITRLQENRRGVVPNRLTYLAAARNVPSRLLQSNWNRGAEWRDWFVTGIGVSTLEVPPAPDIMTRLHLHLQSLYQAEQAEIYRRLLLPNARNSAGDEVSLFDEMSQVSIAKALLRVQMTLFYPQSLLNSDLLLMAIAGDTGLLEDRTLRRFRENNVALTSVSQTALERLRGLQSAWTNQPEGVRRNVSLPPSLTYAQTRLDILYRNFFSAPPEPLGELEIKDKPPKGN